MKTHRLDIGQDFSDVPSGRYPEDGDFNGQRFRKEFLVPLLHANDRLEVVLDNTEGFGSSFLEEAFGGLIREEGFRKGDLEGRLVLISGEPRTKRYKRKIEQYLDKAEASLRNG